MYGSNKENSYRQGIIGVLPQAEPGSNKQDESFVHRRGAHHRATDGPRRSRSLARPPAPTASLRIDHGKVKKLEIARAPATPRLQILAQKNWSGGELPESEAVLMAS